MEASAAAASVQAGNQTTTSATQAESPEEPALPNVISLILMVKIGGVPVKNTPVGHFLETYEFQIFLVFIVALMSVFIFGTLRLRLMIPGRLQALLEMTVEAFYKFMEGLLGEKYARRHFAFIATLFFFIWVNNMFGLIPFMTGATARFQTTITLAVMVFFYVHYHGIKESGLLRWLHHLAGSPQDAVGWAISPLMFMLEVISELAKPLSLSLRLFGNMTGEHILTGVFLILGIILMGAVWTHPLVGVPLHTPFLFLALLTGTIQALVFTLLSAIYLMMVLPHEHEGEDHEDKH
ncbi:MAG: F0F1 ATP synthase subunit A [Candidatus Sumerlaeota bacterium]|nr:F0F1 ATP synthase subunit A [Candidatus Sumerlaeota bacterium]